MSYTDSTDDTSEAEGSDDYELFCRMRKWFRLDAEHSRKWRKNAAEDFRLYAGDQWDEEALEVLRSQNRPIVAFNRIQPTINVVSGSEISNRQEIRCAPRTMGAASVSETVTAGVTWFRDEAGAEDEESDAFRDVLVCGMGWVDTGLDYDALPDGKPRCDRIDPLEMFWDCNARKPNLADAKRVFRVRNIPLADAKDLVDDDSLNDGDYNAGWADSTKMDDQKDMEDVRAKYYEDGSNQGDDDDDDGEVTIVEIQWMEREPFHRVLDPADGQIKSLSVDEFDTLTSRLKEMGAPEPQSIKQMRWCRYRAFLGKKILKQGKLDISPNHFTYQAITGLRDQSTGTWFGLVRPMADPQRWANKFFSQTLHIMNSSAKGGIMLERGAVEDVREFERSWSRTDAVTYFNNGALAGGKVQPKPEANFPAGIWNMMEFAITSIRDATGVNQEMLGLRDATQPGVLEAQRKQSTMTIIATFFDSLRRYRKISGRIILHILQNYVPDGTLVRVVGQDMEQYVPLMKDEFLVEYDIIVDESPTSPNQKDKVWGMIAPMFQQLPPPVQMALLKYSPLPEAAVADVQKAMGDMMQNQPPDPNQAKAEAQTQMAQNKMQIDQQKAVVEQQTAAQAAAQAAQESQAKIQLQAQQSQQDFALQMEQMRQEIAMMQQKMASEQSLAVQKAQMDRETAREKAQIDAASRIETARIAAQHAPKPKTEA